MLETDILDFSASLPKGYLKSPFKTRGRLAVQTSSPTEKVDTFVEAAPLNVKMKHKRSLEPLADANRLELVD